MKTMQLKFLINSLIILLLAGFSYADAAIWKVPQDFATIQDAVDDASVVDGDTIIVSKGKHAGATVTKSLTIRGRRAKITSGPALGPFSVGFRFPIDGSGSGSTIEHFRFLNVDLPIYAEKTDGVKVKCNFFRNSIQAVTNWGGSSWRIASNTLFKLRVGNSGGIGIFIGDRDNVPEGVTGNLIVNNKMYGRVRVDEGSIGEFRGAGVALFAAFSGGASKADFIASNLIDGNFISFRSNNPSLVDVVGIELSEAVETLTEAKVFGNILIHNCIETDEPYGLVPSDVFFENEFFLNKPAAQAPVLLPLQSFSLLLALPEADSEASEVVLNPI